MGVVAADWLLLSAPVFFTNPGSHSKINKYDVGKIDLSSPILSEK
jgi:hypothetical protein